MWQREETKEDNILYPFKDRSWLYCGCLGIPFRKDDNSKLEMPLLENFMESLIQEQDKLVEMGTIKSTKDQKISTSVLNQSKYKNKSKVSK